MRFAANKLHEMGSRALVITGGHLEKAIDLLSFKPSEGSNRKFSRQNGSAPTLPTEQDAHSRPPWRVIWLWIADYPKLPCWPRPTSLRRSLPAIHLVAEQARFIISTVWTSSVARQVQEVTLNLLVRALAQGVGNRGKRISRDRSKVFSAEFQPQTMRLPPAATRYATSGSLETPPGSTPCRRS